MPWYYCRELSPYILVALSFHFFRNYEEVVVLLLAVWMLTLETGGKRDRGDARP